MSELWAQFDNLQSFIIEGQEQMVASNFITVIRWSLVNNWMTTLKCPWTVTTQVI
jgi:hypothetical protein